MNSDIEQILAVSTRAAREGKPAAARALLQALVHEHPDLVQAWVGLAAVAPNANERIAALERAAALSPDYPGVQAALEQARPPTPLPPSTPPEPTPVPLPPMQLTLPVALPRELTQSIPTPPPVEVRTIPHPKRPPFARKRGIRRSRASWQQLLIFALMTFIVLALSIWVVAALPFFAPSTPSISPTPSLPGAAAMVQSESSLTPTQAPPSPQIRATNQPFTPTEIMATRSTATSATAPTTTASPLRDQPLPAALPMGKLLEDNGWHAVLLRPDFAIVLDGAIGDLRPNGRFVLALISVSNTNDTPRTIPTTLFQLNDQQGRHYQPLRTISSVYLQIYGRGQHGDLALEDTIPPGGGMVSVPLIFDVPANATDLQLTMGSYPNGWGVLETLPPLDL